MIPVVDVRFEPAAAEEPSEAAAKTTVHKLSTHRLDAYYGDFLALREVDFTAAEGEITAIIGPSGCGKSTLVRSLNRMNDLVPGFRAEGRILLDSTDINGRGVDIIAIRRRMGMLFQRPNPFPMSVFDNVAYGLRLAGRLPRAELEERVNAALERVGLLHDVHDRLKRSALSLSGGQQQRLCLARALAVDPDVILMDEPTSALDPVATLRIEELLAELSGTVTMVIVTHNLQQAARVSQRTAFMMMGEGRAGELVEQGPTADIFRTPRQRATEDYITGRFG